MVIDKQRVLNAYAAMKILGVSEATVKPVLKRLLLLYKSWELIEDDNYRTLADAIFEDGDDQKKKAEVEPPFKRPHGGLPQDQISSGNSKTNLDGEVTEAQKSSSGTRIVESTQSFSGKKDNSIVLDEKDSSFEPASSIVLYDNPKPDDIALGETGRDQEDRKTAVLRGKQPIDDHSLRFAMPAPSFRPDIKQQLNTRKRPNESSLAIGSPRTFQTTHDIASSACGKVKLSLTYNHAQQQNKLHIPSSDEVLNFVTRKNLASVLDRAKSKYQRSCKPVEPQFPLINLLNEVCESYLEMGADHQDGSPGKRAASNSSGSSNKTRVIYKVDDITKGTEKVKISLINEVGMEELPSYIYSPQNITYESAHVHVSLARISDMDHCLSCEGDCLSSSIPCACARDTGGVFAYTQKGLLDEKFLNSCISLKRWPEKHHHFFCKDKDCPLERAKNADSPDDCNGHISRTFIKECWRKCGCSMQCGNRVVQRGITRKLQVFLTGEGKGWGLRTLEELPKGAFVCEFIGEILTNIELFERNKKNHGQNKHVYPVLLDADWGTEGVLKDEEALCLDATHYGNIARFINHQCFDGNLIEVPVQVETPDRHYYHLAFFTKRKVQALEELTWDYGIHFDDDSHPIDAFQCRCGSQYCRGKNKKRKHSSAS